jgi:hypothetical protein
VGSGAQQVGSGAAQTGSGAQQVGSGAQHFGLQQEANLCFRCWNKPTRHFGAQQLGSGAQQEGSGAQQVGSGAQPQPWPALALNSPASAVAAAEISIPITSIAGRTIRVFIERTPVLSQNHEKRNGILGTLSGPPKFRQPYHGSPDFTRPNKGPNTPKLLLWAGTTGAIVNAFT